MEHLIEWLSIIWRGVEVQKGEGVEVQEGGVGSRVVQGICVLVVGYEEAEKWTWIAPAAPAMTRFSGFIAMTANARQAFSRTAGVVGYCFMTKTKACQGT